MHAWVDRSTSLVWILAFDKAFEEGTRRESLRCVDSGKWKIEE